MINKLPTSEEIDEILKSLGEICDKLGWCVAVEHGNEAAGFIIGVKDYIEVVTACLQEEYDIYEPGSFTDSFKKGELH